MIWPGMYLAKYWDFTHHRLEKGVCSCSKFTGKGDRLQMLTTWPQVR